MAVEHYNHKTITVVLDKKIHKAFKILCAQKNMTMSKTILFLIKKIIKISKGK